MNVLLFFGVVNAVALVLNAYLFFKKKNGDNMPYNMVDGKPKFTLFGQRQQAPPAAPMPTQQVSPSDPVFTVKDALENILQSLPVMLNNQQAIYEEIKKLHERVEELEEKKKK